MGLIWDFGTDQREEGFGGFLIMLLLDEVP